MSDALYQTGLAWRTDQVDLDPDSVENPWDIFWDPQYKGEVGLHDDDRETLTVALYHDGREHRVPPNLESAGVREEDFEIGQVPVQLTPEVDQTPGGRPAVEAGLVDGPGRWLTRPRTRPDEPGLPRQRGSPPLRGGLQVARRWAPGRRLDGRNRPKGGHALSILPGLTHDDTLSSPLFAATTRPSSTGRRPAVGLH